MLRSTQGSGSRLRKRTSSVKTASTVLDEESAFFEEGHEIN